MLSISGLWFSFNKHLEIEMTDSAWSKEETQKFYVFQKKDDVQNAVIIQTVGGADFVVAQEPVDQGISQQEFDQLSKLVSCEDENVFRCILCGFVAREIASVTGHIFSQHPLWRDWRKEPSSSSSTISNSSTVFQSPNWKESLTDNFDTLVIQKCGQDTREAWASNLAIKDLEKYTLIRREILQKLVDYISGIFGTISCPSIEDLRFIHRESLVGGYPWMFGLGDNTASKDAEISHGYGRGGINGAEELPKQLRDRISKLIAKRRKDEIVKEANGRGEDEADLSASKKGRRPNKYGEC